MDRSISKIQGILEVDMDGFSFKRVWTLRDICLLILLFFVLEKGLECKCFHNE